MGEEETSQHLTSPASFFISFYFLLVFLFFSPWAQFSERVPKSAAVEGIVAAQRCEPTLPPLSSWKACEGLENKESPTGRRCASPLRNVFTAYAGVSREREREKRAKSLVPTTPTRLLLERCNRGGRDHGPDARSPSWGSARPAVRAARAPNFQHKSAAWTDVDVIAKTNLHPRGTREDSLKGLLLRNDNTKKKKLASCQFRPKSKSYPSWLNT